jgi:hypothetical protein
LVVVCNKGEITVEFKKREKEEWHMKLP